MSPHTAGIELAEIASSNLLCANGLRGAEQLDMDRFLSTLEGWTGMVRRYTAASACGRTYERRAAFCFIAMVTLLKHPRGLGIRYQPSAIGNFNFADSRDDFLHGPLTRRTGTCASLPVLFTAIGRRLGYPMYLAIAKGHVFCQWVDDDGVINLEGSCPSGGNIYPREHYLQWPRPLTQRDLASGRYLRPLNNDETLALFLETRGHCLVDNRRFDEAREAYKQAAQVAPHWSDCDRHLWSLSLHEERASKQEATCTTRI
jgi:hypothetical protein